MMTRRTVLGGLLAVLVSVPLASAQETITLTVPVARAALATYTPVSLTLDLGAPHIRVVIQGSDGVTLVFEYPCASPCANDTPARVTTLIGNLNTANLTTRSLWRRVMDRLILDFPTRFPGAATVP